MPREKRFDGLGILAGKRFQGGFGSDESGVERIRCGAFVAAIAEKAKAVFVIGNRFLACASDEFGPFGLRDGNGGARGCLEAFESAAAKAPRLGFSVLVEAMSGLEEGIVIENVEGGSVDGLGFGFAPVPKGSEDCHTTVGKISVARDSPERVGIAFAHDGRVANEAVAGLAEPVGATESRQLLFELVSEGEEMRGVVDGIIEHLWGEWADGPVGFLGSFREDESEVVVEQGGETELAESDKAGGDAGVKNVFGVSPTGFSEESEIVVASVDDDSFAFEHGKEGREVERGEGVDEEVGF